MVQRNFERRRLALGDCGRAYGTSCIHEHSCVRCPLLRVDPNQRRRLIDIRDNLIGRIAEAEREGWAGEAEGLHVSLAAAKDKLAQIDSAVQRRNAAVELGMPSFPTIASRTVAASASPVSRLQDASPTRDGPSSSQSQSSEACQRAGDTDAHPLNARSSFGRRCLWLLALLAPTSEWRRRVGSGMVMTARARPPPQSIQRLAPLCQGRIRAGRTSLDHAYHQDERDDQGGPD
jgi:hypothetical protein